MPDVLDAKLLRLYYVNLAEVYDWDIKKGR